MPIKGSAKFIPAYAGFRERNLMKYIKMLGLAAVAAAGLMTFVGVGTASAATLTSPANTVVPVGTLIKAENEGKVVLDPPFGAIECSNSIVEGKVTNAGGVVGGVTQTVKGEIITLDFTVCNATVTVLKKGTLEIHSLGNGNGTLTSNGAEVTVSFVGTHCIYRTGDIFTDTDLGTVTGSATTKGNATFHIKATIPRVGGLSGLFCGSGAEWTGAYKVTSPNPLFID
jgi:hypothetical protein